MRPVCKCHGRPMYVNPGSNGGWRCAVRHRGREYVHYHTRGWKVARLNDLKKQRERIVTELEGLDRDRTIP